jgi:serine/threonine protein kinase
MSFNFTKKNRLGSGAYGTVYEIEFENKIFALKRIRTNRKYPWNEQNAIRELVTAFSLPYHPNILQFHASFVENSNVFFIFPKLTCNVYQKIKHTRPSIDLILKWSYQLLSGIGHMHEHGFFHRDIKMENLLLNEDDNLVIGDFGMSKCFSSLTSKMSGRVCSSWTRPPEIKNNQNNYYDDRFDSWSVGCVMIAIAAGKYIFRSSEKQTTLESIIEILGQNQSEENQLKTLRSFCHKDLPDYFFTYVLQFLQIDPIKRQTIRNILKLWPYYQNVDCKKELCNFNLEYMIEEKKDVIFYYQNTNKKHIGDWIWKVCKKFQLSETTALQSFLCFLRCKNQNILFAAASCSLISRVNESSSFSSQIWAKTIGCKLKNLESSESIILKDLGAKLILNMTNVSIPCVFLLLCCTDYELEKIKKIATEDFTIHDAWKSGHADLPHIK